MIMPARSALNPGISRASTAWASSNKPGESFDQTGVYDRVLTTYSNPKGLDRRRRAFYGACNEPECPITATPGFKLLFYFIRNKFIVCKFNNIFSKKDGWLRSRLNQDAITSVAVAGHGRRQNAEYSAFPGPAEPYPLH
jgi:hypothetical protein